MSQRCGGQVQEKGTETEGPLPSLEDPETAYLPFLFPLAVSMAAEEDSIPK